MNIETIPQEKFMPINGWTKPKVIEQLKKKLPKNGEKCEVNKTCVYTNDIGECCAVGAFIPEKHPASQVNMSVSTVLRKYPELITKMPLNIEGMWLLQKAHDFGSISKTKDRVIEWVYNNVQD